MTNLPQISFVMPTRNGEQFIEEAARSILNQSVENLELIIVDDHSNEKDATESIIRTINDPRIRFFRLGNSFGRNACAARNYGNALAKSEIIAVCDADDLYNPDRAKLTLEAFSHGCAVFYGNYEILRQQTGIILQRSNEQPIIPFDLSTLVKYNYIPHGSAAYKRTDALLFPYNSFFTLAEDYDLFTRLAQSKRQFHYCPEIIFTYRIHENNTSYGHSSPIFDEFIRQSRGWEKIDPKTAEIIIHRKYR